MKIWLCGMVRGQRDVLEKTIGSIYQYFDGCIFVVDDRATTADIEWLQSIKKNGKIIIKKWVNDHAHTSNEVLLSGVMRNGDYFVWIDETDALTLNFVRDLRASVKHWSDNNVGAVYIDHPFVLRFHDGLRFAGSPHWGVINVIGESISFEKVESYKKENYVINNREILKSAFLNPAKYYFCYPNLSNHTQLLYTHFGKNIWEEHERFRIQFRNHCRKELGLEFSLDSLITYLEENVGKYSDFFEQVIEIETNVKDLFRLYVLNQSLDSLIKNRFDWSYFIWKKEGLIDQDPEQTKFMGQYNKYNLSIGRKRE